MRLVSAHTEEFMISLVAHLLKYAVKVNERSSTVGLDSLPKLSKVGDQSCHDSRWLDRNFNLFLLQHVTLRTF